jgi:hypothetical protein
MRESTFRVIIGLFLLALLFADFTYGIYAYCGYLMLEFISNIRFTSILNHFKDKTGLMAGAYNDFDSERVLRLVVVAIVMGATVFNNSFTWPINWFVALMLVAAGITKICPMKMGLAWIGLK